MGAAFCFNAARPYFHHLPRLCLDKSSDNPIVSGMSMAIGSNLLTSAEVATILGVSQGRVRQFVVEDRLKAAKKIGTNLLFDPKQVARFAKAPRISGRPKKTS